MTINPESVKAYARELLEAEERGRREVNAELLAVARALVDRHDAYAKSRNFTGCGCDDCMPFRIPIRKAERQGEALEVVGNRGAGG